MFNVNKFFRTYESFVWSGGIIVIAILGLVFGIIPLIQKDIDLWGAVGQMQNDIVAYSAKKSALENIDLTTTRANLAGLAAAIPPDKSVPSVFLTLDSVTADTNVSLDNIDISSPGNIATGAAIPVKRGAQIAADKGALPFTLSITGSYVSVKNFLDKIVSVRRLMKVKSFSVTFKSGVAGSARVDLETYYAPFPTTISAISQPLVTLSDADNEMMNKVLAMPLAAYNPAAVSVTSGATESANLTASVDPFSP